MFRQGSEKDSDKGLSKGLGLRSGFGSGWVKAGFGHKLGQGFGLELGLGLGFDQGFGQRFGQSFRLGFGQGVRLGCRLGFRLGFELGFELGFGQGLGKGVTTSDTKIELVVFNIKTGKMCYTGEHIAAVTATGLHMHTETQDVITCQTENCTIMNKSDIEDNSDIHDIYAFFKENYLKRGFENIHQLTILEKNSYVTQNY